MALTSSFPDSSVFIRDQLKGVSSAEWDAAVVLPAVGISAKWLQSDTASHFCSAGNGISSQHSYPDGATVSFDENKKLHGRINDSLGNLLYFDHGRLIRYTVGAERYRELTGPVSPTGEAKLA